MGESAAATQAGSKSCSMLGKSQGCKGPETDRAPCKAKRVEAGHDVSQEDAGGNAKAYYSHPQPDDGQASPVPGSAVGMGDKKRRSP